MPPLLALLLPALLLPVRAATRPQGTAAGTVDEAARARVSLEAPQGPIWVDGPLDLRVVIELEERLREDELLQLYPRPLDLPVQVLGPWLGELPGLRRLPAPSTEEGPAPSTEEGPDPGPELALGEGLARARRLGNVLREGRIWCRYAVDLRRQPTFPGPLELAAPELRYAHATRFEEQGLFGPHPLDRREERVRGEPLTLEVRPLPEEGRPESFRGAVGRLEPRLVVEPRELVQGDTLELTLVPGGDGVGDGLEPPSPDLGGGLRLLAVREEGRGPSLRIVYQFEVLATGRFLAPALELAWFDPTPPAGYRTWRSERVELQARPGAEGGPEPAPRPGAPGPGGVVVAALAGLLAAAAWLLSRRRHAPGPRFRAPYVQLLAQGQDPTDVWLAYLAARLGTTPSGVVGPELEGRLIAAGVAAEPAREAARLAETLLEARYGGDPPPDPDQRVVRALETLDRAWPA